MQRGRGIEKGPGLLLLLGLRMGPVVSLLVNLKHKSENLKCRKGKIQVTQMCSY